MNLRAAVRISLSLALLVATRAPAAKQPRPASPVRHTRKVTAQAPAPSLATHLAAARTAFFLRSDLNSARAHLEAVLHRDRGNLEAQFLRMEGAALEADTTQVLNSALELCERHATGDPRVSIAAARILDLAGNTAEFRPLAPRMRAVIARGTPQVNYLRAALLTAATDGAPGPAPLELARQSGLLTDWRVAGPFGRYSNVDFDRAWPPERDQLAQNASGARQVERFQFADGNLSLPEYLPHDGVYYAASQVTVKARADLRLRIESAGTAEVFVDGSSVLRKDDRFRASPEIAWRILRISAGSHRVVVKFLPDAAPLRIALLPVTAETLNTVAGTMDFPPEAAFVAAAQHYWRGDYNGTIAALGREQRPSAAANFLLAQAWWRISPGSAESSTHLRATLAAAPGAIAAEYWLAARAHAENRDEEAAQRMRRVTAAQPYFVSARELMAQVALRLDWQAEALQATQARLQLHASCEALREAARLYSSASQYARAAEAEARLKGCAPGSLAYAQALGDRGEHAQAVAAATSVLAQRPLDRNARMLLVRELALAGKNAEAQDAARQLVALAPNWERARQLAGMTGSRMPVLDVERARGAEFAEGSEFFAPYRRDALRLLAQTAERRFSGGPAVVLLHDRVGRLEADGSVALYVHKITRMLTRDGVAQYGEVALPEGADLLELRTITAAGVIAEPEFTPHKTTISMPALAPGDAVEEEYVVRYGDRSGLTGHADAFRYSFGSFTAPILFARFVVLTPKADERRLQLSVTGNAPPASTLMQGGSIVRVWERDDIAQSVQEVSLPPADVLPTVRVIPAQERGWADVRDFYRDLLISATRTGPQVEAAARAVAGNTEEDKARAIYHGVASKVRSSAGSLADGEVPTAEETLASRVGSRTVALVAIARAAGLHAEVLLARSAGASKPTLASPQAYSRPLVLIRLKKQGGAERAIALDAETEGSGFGALSPTIELGDALPVPIGPSPGAALATARIVPVPGTPRAERSIAEGDVSFDPDGTLIAKIEIRMGAWRGAQMRSVLRGIEPGGRKHFFEQLAMRIFAGASDAEGEVLHEDDPDQPLEIRLSCRASRFLNLAAGSADLDQLVPALGLRKMYVNLVPRKFPLFVDTPLVESATFRVRLPEGVQISHLAPSQQVESEFGNYAVQFRQLAPGQFEVRREFRIPVQVVRPEQYEAFTRFAWRIDHAERQRLSVERAPETVAAR